MLTNYREENQAIVQGARSRGLIPNAWLKSGVKSEMSSEEFARQMIEEDGVEGVGGFSLCYGFVQDVVKPSNLTSRASTSPEVSSEVSSSEEKGKQGKKQLHKGLTILSNRTPLSTLPHILTHPSQTTALSNTLFTNHTWPKVLHGEALTAAAIAQSVAANETRDELVTRLLAVLSTDTMPPRKPNEEWENYLMQLRQSVFIPAIGGDVVEQDSVRDEVGGATSGRYGTGKQSIVLVDREGKVFYLERTLFDQDAKPIAEGEGDRVFEFRVEGW